MHTAPLTFAKIPSAVLQAACYSRHFFLRQQHLFVSVYSSQYLKRERIDLQMLPKPDFSSLDAKESISSQCTVNKNSPLISETFRCTPCAQVFMNANDLIIHKEEHIPVSITLTE